MFGSSEVSRFCFMDYILLMAKPLSHGKMKLVLECQLSWNKTIKFSRHCLYKQCFWVGLEFSNCPDCFGASPEGQWSFVNRLYSGLCCNYPLAWVCLWCCCWRCSRQVCCPHCLRCRGVVGQSMVPCGYKLEGTQKDQWVQLRLGATTVSLRSLFQWLTMLPVNHLSLMSSVNSPWCSFIPFFFVSSIYVFIQITFFQKTYGMLHVPSC